jgi:hypothetical protein
VHFVGVVCASRLKDRKPAVPLVFGADLTVAATAAALRFQEGQQVGVNGIGLGRGHAVGKALVGF